MEVYLILMGETLTLPLVLGILKQTIVSERKFLMCTALTLESGDGYHFFGRTMDIAYHFNQSPMVVPRSFPLKNRITGEEWHNSYAMLGMGMVMENHPFFAEGMNEEGLAVAGLNFPKLAVYEKTSRENATNIPPYDLILWLLGHFSTVKQVREAIESLCLVDEPFSPQLPQPTLHWIVYDKEGDCITIEKTAEKFAVYENTVGVLANAPSFDWHLTNLNQYAGLSNAQPQPVKWGNQTLAPQADGLGLRGLPGDSYSPSRFVRSAYMRNHVTDISTKETTLGTFFQCLDNLTMVTGTVLTLEGLMDETIYKSAMNLEEGIYYYKTKNNAQINGVRMSHVDATEIALFPLRDQQAVAWEN